MRIIPVKAENGLLKIPEDFKVPEDAQLSILLTRRDEDYISIFDRNESFSFLASEPDLYGDKDILKNRKNENFSN
jgi:hypothetical protein